MQRIGEIVSAQKSPKSPSSPAQSYENEKTRKYDRQLRIWGDTGQYLIEICNVCLVNASATGTEVLKNLVLSGIGSFTIIDGNKINTEDDNNFFCDRSSIGKNRGQVACSSLLELNPDVSGDYIEESPETLLDTNPDVFTRFSIVIVANCYNEKTLCKLSQYLWDHNVPLIVAHSLGFVGLIRIQIREHPVIESHPDNVLEDLRLDKPFEELREYFDSYGDLTTMPRQKISRVPFLVILYRFLKLWQAKNNKSDDSLPKNYKEKEQLRNLIREAIENINAKLQETQDNSDEGIESEIELENFQEAIRAVNTALVNSKFIPSETQKIIDDPRVEEVLDNKVHNTSFWLLVKGLKRFLKDKSNGCLPVRGSIPDMTADTQSYVALQKIYSNKAKQDMDCLLNCLSSICDSSERFLEMIPEETIRIFCRNAHCLKLIRTSPLFHELSPQDKDASLTKLRETINCPESSDEGNDLEFFLVLRAVMRFHTMHNRFPGYYQEESDNAALKTCFKEVLSDLGCSHVPKDEYIQEVCRYGGAELHSVSAFIGGCAAQEAIKFITKQFAPLKSTLIYNAITSTTVTYGW